MKICFLFIIILIAASTSFAQTSKNNSSKPDPAKKIVVVETACGECQFKMKGSGCNLAIRINAKNYFVDGTTIDEHGDAHSEGGFCNSIRKAEVQGDTINNRFKVTYFKLLPATINTGVKNKKER